MDIQLSCDDGGKYDLVAANFLKKYNLPCTFYIPNVSVITGNQIKKLANDFEIGGHTVLHFPDLRKLEDIVVDYEIVENRKFLQELTGQEITSFCYPRGGYDNKIIEAVKRAGYKEARTVKVLQTKFNKNKPFEKPTTIHAYHRKEYKGKNFTSLTEKYLKKAEKENGYFHFWFHSLELYKFKKWVEFENSLKIISKYYEKHRNHGN